METKLCRCCMKEAKSWELSNYDRGVWYMFSTCTNILAADDGLPKEFCFNCITQIESCYRFIQTARNNNEKLKQKVVQETEPPDMNEESNDTIDELSQNLSEAVHLDDTHATGMNETDDVKQLKSRMQAESEQFSCTSCKKTFMSKVWFDKHIKNYHGEKKFKCPQCPKAFRTPSRLAAHAVTHSGERKFACPCGRRYKRRKELTAHELTHAAGRPHVCPHCRLGFKLKSVLKSHLVLHQKDKPFLCSVCGAGFTQAGNLSAHMRTHTGAKPYACPCGFRASAASSLRRHQRKHRAARPHRCRTCRKAFHDKAALTRHERSHTGARPYRCPLCPHAAVDSWKRKCHMMRAHRIPLARIPRMRADPVGSLNDSDPEHFAGFPPVEPGHHRALLEAYNQLLNRDTMNLSPPEPIAGPSSLII